MRFVFVLLLLVLFLVGCNSNAFRSCYYKCHDLQTVGSDCYVDGFDVVGCDEAHDIKLFCFDECKAGGV